MTTQDRSDWIQARVIARARDLGLTSGAIARRIGGLVSENHIRCYLGKTKSMGSHKLQHVLSALGLTIEEMAPATAPPDEPGDRWDGLS